MVELPARPTLGAARERIKPMQNSRARVRTRGLQAVRLSRVLLPAPGSSKARSADDQRSPARPFIKRNGRAPGETDIGRGARTDKADAKFESESPHQRTTGRSFKPGAVASARYLEGPIG